MQTLQLIRKLNYINRCCLFPLVKPTTVAEHSFHVAVIALTISEDLKEAGQPVDQFKVLKHALLHDVEESIISDIPYTVKMHIRPSLAEALRIMGEDQLVDVPEWLTREIYAECDGSMEWLVVKAADMVELLMYCRDEERLGNLNLKSMVDRGWEVTKELSDRIPSPWLKSTVSSLS